MTRKFEETRSYEKYEGHVSECLRFTVDFVVVVLGESSATHINTVPHRKSYSGSLTKAGKLGHLHADLKGPISPICEEGHRYFLNVVDEYSRLIFVKALRRKGEASAALLHYVKVFERQSGFRVKSLHTDGGGEFKKAAKRLKSQGVNVTCTTSYTPASNGLVERANGIVLSLSRACLLQAKLPLSFWHYTIEHVSLAKNMVVHPTTNKVPYSIVYGSDPPYTKHIRPFGCRILYHPVSPKLKAFESRLQEGICLGHEQGGVYTVLTREKIIRTKHVRFHEDTFPGYSAVTDYEQGSVSSRDDDEGESWNDSGSDEDVDSDSDATEVLIGGSTEETQDEQEGLEEESVDTLTHYPAEPSRHGEGVDNSHVNDEIESGNEGLEEGTTEESTVHGRPCDNLRPRKNVNYTFKALPEAISTSDEPSLREALKSTEEQQWRKAISEEFETLKKAETWKECEGTVPPGTQVLPSGVILRLKRDDMGRPARFKGRLAARGNFQSTADSAYTDRYAPVACIDLVRLLLALSVAYGWTRQHVDIKGAFLHARLPETLDIWVRLLNIPGIDEANGRIVKLVKSLYGLRQAPRLWYDVLARTLQSLGFRGSRTSDCLFIYSSTSGKLFLLAYVDDLLLLGNKGLVQQVKDNLAELFTVTDLGECKFFLGVRVQPTVNGLFLSQTSFIQKVISQANMATAKPTATPLPLSHPLYDERRPVPDEEKASMEVVPYREVLGSLIYLCTRTRPDLATAVSMMGKSQADPAMKHWKTLKNVVRYLIEAPHHGILLQNKGKEVILEALCDADWARDHSKRRSRSGYVLFVNDSPIIWTSKLQTSTALSTAEAEFTALSSCIREVKWLRDVLQELGVTMDEPTTVYQDNLGSIAWTEEVQGL